MPQRILILMSDTGGGHRAAARAIAEAVDHLYPGRFEVRIEDIWADHTGWPINRLPAAYPWLADAGARWWQLIWDLSLQRPLRQGVLAAANLFIQRRIVRLLAAWQPDAVVSVHPLLTALGAGWVDRARLRVPFFSVVTDLVTVHPAWVHPAATGCFVATPASRDQVIAHGMPRQKVFLCGQPVSLKFARPLADKPALRRRLGMHPTRPAVLIVGGGEGVGRVYEIAQAVAEAAASAQLVVVAGRNRALKARLDSAAWPIPTQTYGFTQRMPELMAAADLLITKAGPGMIAEACISGLPMILSGFIPGQEAGNVHYVLGNGAGVYVTEPAQIAALAREWLAPGHPVLARMGQNASRLARPQAALAIARHICRLALLRPGGVTPEMQHAAAPGLTRGRAEG